jgi:acyl-CoA carboxylase subunit beta
VFRAGRKIDEEAVNARKEIFKSIVEQESDVYYTSSRILDDGVIDPRDSRNIVGLCLQIIHGGDVKGGNLYGVSRM